MTQAISPWSPLATHDLPDSSPIVVIGSGFGAAVSAARLAERAPGQVLLLERGDEWLPGEFPRTFGDIRTAVRSRRNPAGLFDFQVGRDHDSLVASGLGGGSLIYANVLLEACPGVFDRHWPEGIDQERLAPFIARVLSILRPEAHPGAEKAAALAHLAKARSTTVRRVPLAVNLTRPSGPNAVGVVQPPCTGCGNCVTGCNVGAKTTLWASYLPVAARNGARLVTRSLVESIGPSERPGRRWVVRGSRWSRRGARFRWEPFEVHTDVVMVGAGALGTTGILLRSAALGLPLSPALGTRFSGNADSLAVSYNTAARQTGFGAADPWRPDPAPGPTITSAVDLRTSEGGHLVQDGALPHGLAEAMRRILGARFALQRDSRVWCDLRAGGCPPGCGALEHSQVWLAMGSDSAEGRLRLDRSGNVRVEWPGSGGQVVYEREADDLALLSEGARATHVTNPRHALAGRGIAARTPITVHPLGGAPMADTVDAGACDERGRLFRPDGSVHEGLYVVDGSLCPTSTGANPSLTIAALAEYVVDGLIEDDLARLQDPR